jgi:hypothetical protein
MIGRQSLKANAKGYRKTPMQALLDKAHIDSLREYIELPSTVKDAKPILMMFIERNDQFQHPSPETVLNNILQFALAYKQFSGGRKLDLTMTERIAIPMPPPSNEEEGKPEKRAKPKPEKPVTPSPKKSTTIEQVEVDEEVEAELMELRKKLLIAKKRKALEDELRALTIEDE